MIIALGQCDLAHLPKLYPYSTKTGKETETKNTGSPFFRSRSQASRIEAVYPIHIISLDRFGYVLASVCLAPMVESDSIVATHSMIYSGLSFKCEWKIVPYFISNTKDPQLRVPLFKIARALSESIESEIFRSTIEDRPKNSTQLESVQFIFSLEYLHERFHT